MNLNHLPERVSEALIRATGHRDAGHSGFEIDDSNAGEAPPFSVAISREAGTRGPAVARAVGERLGWQVYDNELLELVARDLHVRAKLLENVDERHVSWLQECVEAFAAVPAVREGKYVRHLIETMLSLAARGRCVIVGRGSPFVLPPATTLRVRLMAPLADRIAAVCQDRRMTRREAARFIEHTDRERSHFVRLHLQRDAADPQNYDLCLNTVQFSTEECAEIIVGGLQAKSHAQVTPASFHPEMVLATI
jgi:cytidylate kinase